MQPDPRDYEIRIWYSAEYSNQLISADIPAPPCENSFATRVGKKMSPQSQA